MSDTDETIVEDENLKPTRKEVFGWMLYDFANTSFSVIIVTALYSVYLKDMANTMTGIPNFGDYIWGLAGSITMLIIALTSPILGAIADYSGKKKTFVWFYTFLCIIFTALLYFVTPSLNFFGIPAYIWGAVLFIIANIGFQGALPFYNAWLPEISTPENTSKISGWGFAFGYVGAMLSVIIAMIITIIYPSSTYGDFGIRLAFVSAALFFLVFGVPAIMMLKSRPPKKRPEEEGKSYVSIGFARVKRSFRLMKQFPSLPTFLIAYFLFSDAITTVIYFAAIFATTTLSYTTMEVLLLFIVTQFAAIPGAFIFGYIGDKIGTKKTLIITLLIWIAVCIGGYLSYDKMTFLYIAMLAGVGMGSSQSTARAMFSGYIPEEKKSEMFGFYALTGKFAAILGPLVFGVVSLLAGQRIAILTLTIFFVLAMIILIPVKAPEDIGKIEIQLEDDFPAV